MYKIDNQLLYGSSPKQIGLFLRMYLLTIAQTFCEQEIGKLEREYEEKDNSNRKQASKDADNSAGFKTAAKETNAMAHIRKLRERFIVYLKQQDALIQSTSNEIEKYNHVAMRNAPKLYIYTTNNSCRTVVKQQQNNNKTTFNEQHLNNNVVA